MATEINRVYNSNEAAHKNPVSIGHQINNLPPSPELLNYYKKKFEELEEEFIDLHNNLQQYKDTCLQQHQLLLEITERDDMITELQKTVSDLQLCLLQERNIALRLKSENEQLKNRKSLQQYRYDETKISKNIAPDGLTFFLNEPPDLTNRTERRFENKNTDVFSSLNFVSQKQYHTLLNELREVESRLQDVSVTYKKEVNLLLEDRRIQMSEVIAKQKADSLKIQILSQKLKSSQDLLHDNMTKHLELRKSLLDMEQQLLKEKENSFVSKAMKEEVSKQILPEEQYTEHSDQFKGKRIKPIFQQNNKVKSQPPKKSRFPNVPKTIIKKEECKCKEKTNLLTGQIDDLKTKCNKLQEKHRLEVEGFRHDVQCLQKQIIQIEEQLYKLCVLSDSMGQRKEDAILQVIRNTSKRSVNIMDNLNQLKKKLYRLEKNLRFL